MTTQKVIDDFFSSRSIALAGISRAGNKFSNMVFKDLKGKGYQMIPVNPKADTIDGERCYKSLTEVGETPDAALIVTPPDQTAGVVKEALDAGIKNIWIQQGAESAEALKLAEEGGIPFVSGECIFMFAEPVKSIHMFHRWIWKIFGRLPR